MNDLFWALVTVLMIFALWLWNRHKAVILPDSESGHGKIAPGLILLILWSALNFVQNMPAVNAEANRSITIALESLTTAMLMGAILILVITFLVDWPEMRKNGWFRKRSVTFADLMGEVARVPLDRGKVSFVSDVAEALARALQADYYQIKAVEDNRQRRIAAFGIQSDLDVGDDFEYKELDDGLNLVEKNNHCRKHKQIRLHLESSLPEEYQLAFCVPKSQRLLHKPEHQDILQSVLISKLENAARNDEIAARLEIADRQNRLYELNDRDTDIATYLQQVHPIIYDKVKFDYISIAVLDSAIQNMYRYTYADVGGSLIERGICYPLKQTAAMKAAAEKQMLVANTLESDFYRDDYHLYKSGFSSRLIYPICNDSGQAVAVVTLAAVKPKSFNHLDQSDLGFLNAPFCRMIELNNVNSMMNTLKKQVVSSFNLTFGLENSPGLKGFFDRSARILAETLPATMCRIWGYDKPTNRLRSIGYYSLHNRPDKISSRDNEVELELMPRHKTAINMGKAIIVNQTNPDNNMGKSEIEVMGLPGIKSAILSPMRLQNRISGIVSVGEERNWERRSLGHQELLYSQIISTISAMVYDINSKTRDLNRVNADFKKIEMKSQIYDTYPDLPSRISSKLTGVLGAAELMRRKMPEDAREMVRYNEIILSGAESIANELRKFGELKQSILQEKTV
ncbi:MAG: hypothetical protein GF310_07830 [candidate division Zixibacteria bacterium]|nr:hypothetical protein [candidate division Zixibacteria bacterium]